MAEEKNKISEDGLRKLEEELEHLINVERPEYIKELAEARAQGDLSENADYTAALQHKEAVDSRIVELEKFIQNAEVVGESKSTKYVRFGSTVKIKELDTNDEYEYKIVGTVEANPLDGKLSGSSALGEAILDKRVGSIVEVRVENPYKVKILSVS